MGRRQASRGAGTGIASADGRPSPDALPFPVATAFPLLTLWTWSPCPAPTLPTPLNLDWLACPLECAELDNKPFQTYISTAL